MTTHAFDWPETLKKYRGNEKIATEMTTVFFAELSESHKMVNLFFDQKDTKQLYEVLHKLHGSCCFIAVPEFKAIVRKFCDETHQDQKHHQQQDNQNMKHLLDNFNSAYLRLMVYQKDFQQNASS